MAVDDPASWSMWQLFVTTVSGGGLSTALGAVWWFGRKHGENKVRVESLHAAFDRHVDENRETFRGVDERMDAVRDKVGEMATRGDLNQWGAAIQASLAALSARIDSAFRRHEV
jgi:hypothetical protein